MDGKIFARVGAVIFVAIAITATAIEMTRKDEPPEARAAVRAMPVQVDPLHAELNRCQLLGQDGASDRACLRAWAENRQRFLAPGARPAARLSEPPSLPTPAEETR